MRYALAALALMIATPAVAEVRLTCSNGVRDYKVRFNPYERQFSYDDTTYKVLAVEHTDGNLVVSGLTVGEGPTFRAFMLRNPRIEYFRNNKLFETDRCH